LKTGPLHGVSADRLGEPMRFLHAPARVRVVAAGLFPIVVVTLCLAGSRDVGRLAAAGPSGGTIQRALDVEQPDGWKDDLALAAPEDLNPAPDVLEFNLEARVADVEILPGVTTAAWTYNGALPGPYIRVRVGDTLIVHFTNNLPEPTTIHWHGVRVSNDMDGAPGMTQAPVRPGGTFRYEFVLEDAGTFWYHPHHDSSDQVGRGLYGAIVVVDPDEPDVFGDDVVLMLSDISLDDSGQLLERGSGGAFGDLFGREGNVMLVNGRVRPRLGARAGKPQRWRIINASRARYYSFLLPGAPFTRIGGDGGLMARSERQSRLLIVPGERLDVVYTPASPPGTVVPLRWRPVDRGYGTAFNRQAETILEIATADLPAVTPAPVPEQLRTIPPPDTRGAIEHVLDLTIQADGSVVEMGINGIPSWRAEPLHARVGDRHVWTITNNSSFDHPFHLHGYFFRILDERVPEWKDTVNIPVKSTVRLLVEFDERPGMWMYHCHILDHADVGMMGHLHVTE
jgi:FtsP/CotA-like multicopper oxidase with cupredoxin domain